MRLSLEAILFAPRTVADSELLLEAIVERRKAERRTAASLRDVAKAAPLDPCASRANKVRAG